MKTAIMIVMAMVLATSTLYGQAPPVPSEEEPEVLTQGPVNEAFAQPVNMDDETGLIAPTEPPDDIEEVPPAQRPAGEQFSWVPGYWAWDSDRSGYIWVSGCWRAVPPSMHWVPGYWVKVSAGWQWVAGFWAPESNPEIEYLPAPPELPDVEPPGPAQSLDSIWVPPCWYRRHGQYIRRPGYWIVAQENWVWVPSHYIWTPRGYVFANGHWDYALARRGVLFAPVYFPRRVHHRPRFSYNLSITVDMGNLAFGLFTRPRYRHYYFGDYYDSAYVKIGIFPWYECVQRRRVWYDPIYVHDRWRHHRHEPRWEQNQRYEYERRRYNKNLRPPRTYREMEQRARKMPTSQRRHFEYAAPMTRVVSRKTTTFKFIKAKPEARRETSRQSVEVHKFSQDRRNWESQRTSHKDSRPDTERIPSSERHKMTPPAKRDTRPAERRDPTPAGRSHDGDVRRNDREGSTPTPPVRQRPSEVRERTEPKPAGRSHDGDIRRNDREGSTPTPPVRQRPSEVRERTEPKPAGRSHDGEVRRNNREGSTPTPPVRQRPSEVRPQESERRQDRVRIRTSPVTGRHEKESSRKGLPAWPAEEKKD